MRHLNFARALALALAVALLIPCAPVFAAGRTADPDMAVRFPGMAARLGGLHAAPAEVSLAGGTTRVTLRPATNDRSFEAARRFSAPGAEGLLLESADARRNISFQLTDSNGIAAIAADGRAIRFVSNGSGRDLVLAAPMIFGADGRPSLGVRWAVEHDGSRTASIRLVITDRAIAYPAMAIWPTSAGRAKVRTNDLENGTGSITGTVLSGRGGLADALVLLFDANGEYMDNAVTDAGGGYRLGGLGSGSYRLLLISDGYDIQLYHGIPCPDGDCDYSSGTPVTVSDAFATTGVNFSVVNSRTLVSGTVTDRSGNALEGVAVVVYGSGGAAVAAAASKADGSYTAVLQGGGTYYARTYNTVVGGAVDQIYSNIDCTTCDPLTGTAISASQGQEHTGVNFSLTVASGHIAGTVTDEWTARRWPRARSQSYNAAGEAVSYGVTDADGHYSSFKGLVNGTYYAAIDTAGYNAETYRDHVCATRCNPTSGNAIVVSGGGTVSDVDFSLQQTRVYISGVVRDAGSSAPLSGLSVSAYDEAGQYVHTAITDGVGAYLIVVPEPGDYYVRVDSREAAGHIDQLYRATDCSGCQVTGGLKVSTAPGHPAEQIDFSLASDGGTITGHIQDSNGVPVNGFVIISAPPVKWPRRLHGRERQLHAGARPDHRHVLRGSARRRLRADAVRRRLLHELRSDAGHADRGHARREHRRHRLQPQHHRRSHHRPCHGRGYGQPAGERRRGDLRLDRYGRGVRRDGCERCVRRAPSGRRYVLARTHNTDVPGYADQLYNGMACSNCDPTTGTPIPVAASTTTQGIDFVLPVGCSPIAVGPAGTPNTSVGAAYSVTFTATGFTTSVTFTANDGTVPPGLSLNGSTGVLSGTPTTAGTFIFIVTATDVRGCTGEREYTIVVARAVTQTSLTASPSAPIFNQTITLTAAITPSTATGTVVFSEGATALGTVAVAGGSASLNIGTRAPGTYTFTAAYSGDDKHNASTGTKTVVVSKATPVFSNLTSPTVIIGTASKTLTGKLTAGALVPTGTVAITLNGVTQNATIAADGSFSASFNTSALTPLPPATR